MKRYGVSKLTFTPRKVAAVIMKQIDGAAFFVVGALKRTLPVFILLRLFSPAACAKPNGLALPTAFLAFPFLPSMAAFAAAPGRYAIRR